MQATACFERSEQDNKFSRVFASRASIKHKNKAARFSSFSHPFMVSHRSRIRGIEAYSKEHAAISVNSGARLTK